VEVRSVMWCAHFWKHADDDSKEPRDFRHGSTLHRPRTSCRAHVVPLSREPRGTAASIWPCAWRGSSAAAAG
jgi:hypothetical protein